MGSNVKGERVQVSGTANCHRLQLLKRLHIRLYILQKVRTATNGLRLNSDQCLIRCAGVATLAIRTGIRYINWSRNRSDLQVTFISKQERQITNRVQYIFGDDTHLLISEFDSRRIDRKKNVYKIHTLEPRMVGIHLHLQFDVAALGTYFNA